MTHEQKHQTDKSCEHDHNSHKWSEIDHVFQAKSTKNISMQKWFAEHVNDYVISTGSDRKFSVVSFGCGNGSKDQMVLHTVLSKLKFGTKVVYRGVDPDEKALESFREAVEKKADGTKQLQDVDFEFNVKTYEDYAKNEAGESSRGKANLLLFIDSLCHISCKPREALLHCYENELTNDGVMVIFLRNKDDFWFRIRDKLLDGSSIGDIAEDKRATIQDVQEAVERFNWRFKMYPCKYNLDVTDCFQPGSEDGAKVIKLLLGFTGVKESATGPNHEKLLKILDQEAERNGNSRVFNGNHGLIVIYK